MNIIFEKNTVKKKHLILFVHGLTGNKETFFDPMDKNYFYEHFNAKILQNVEIAYLEYHTEIFENNLNLIKEKALRAPIIRNIVNKSPYTPIYNLSIEELSNSAANKIEAIHTEYESINYICHSMGGLVIKGVLINSKTLQKKANFYFTLATPHRGTNRAFLIDGINRQVKGLKEESEVIKYLTHHYQTIKDFFESHYYRATQERWVLPKENAFPISGIKKNTPVDCTHEEISKPRKNFYYDHFIEDINKKIENNLYLTGNNEQVNVLHKDEIEDRLVSIETKIDSLINNSTKVNDNNQTLTSFISEMPNKSIEEKLKINNTTLLNIDTGYTIKDVVMYKEHYYYILLTKYDKSENILVRSSVLNNIDLDFGTNGKLTINFNSDNSNLNKILIQDESIYLIGESVQDKDFKISICKADLNGQLIQEYGNNGYITINSKKEHQYANNSIILKNNNIITVGASFDSKSMLITCINEDGCLVKEFGNNGIIEKQIDKGHTWGNCISKYDETSFIVVGKTSTWEIFISKFTLNGKSDESFRYGGTVLHQHFLRVEDIKVQSNGKILIAGVGNEGRVIRLLSNGMLDTSFAINGILEVITNERSEVLTLELNEDDSFIIGGMEYDGNSYNNGIIAFYTQDGKNKNILDNNFISFHITNKTKVNKIAIHTKNYVTAFCNYNIDYSQNKRTKVATRDFLIE